MLAQAAAQRHRDWVDYTTLGVALFGALTGTLALAWQIIQSRRAGHVVKVKTAWGIGLIRGRPSFILTVTANNQGRGPVQIRSYGILTGGDSQIFDPHPNEASEPLPHVLQGGHEASWAMRIGDLPDQILSANASGPVHFRGFVALGTGERVISPVLKVDTGTLPGMASDEQLGGPSAAGT